MTENSLPRLPKNWAWTTIGQLYDIVGGGTPATCVPEYWNGDIPWITSADITGLKEITPRKYVTKSGVQNSATHVVPEKSLIVVTRVGLGKVGLTNVPICFSQDSQALIGNSSLIYPEYSLYYLSTAVQIFKYRHRGTTISGVTKKQLSELTFPLPPFNEQKRIANKIEELFSFLDAGVESLRKVQAQLKRYRQAVLKYAFEGKLTEEWRKTYKHQIEPAKKLLEKIECEKASDSKYCHLPEIDISEKFSLPEEWTWTTLGNILFLSNVKFDPVTSPDNRFIGLEHIESNTGKIVGYGQSSKTRSTKNKFTKGDVLYGKLRPYLNKVSVADFDGVCSTDILVFSKNQFMDSRFVAKFMLGNDFVKYASQHMSGVQHPRINYQNISIYPVPLPPLIEQQKIANKIERSFTIADATEKTLLNAFVQTEQLRQSILKKAFNGGLVPQVPSDESAETLLRRIKDQNKGLITNYSEGLIKYVK